MPATVIKFSAAELKKPARRRHYWKVQSRRKGLYLKQSRVVGGRLHVGAGLEPLVEAAVIKTMEKFHVSRPLVISLALAHFFNLDIDDAARTHIRALR